MTEMIPSTPAFPFGVTDWAAHELRQRLALPTNEYLMLVLLMVPEVCQPQYLLQKPELSAPLEDVSTN